VWLHIYVCVHVNVYKVRTYVLTCLCVLVWKRLCCQGWRFLVMRVSHIIPANTLEKGRLKGFLFCF
jgi:hypothetical protein